MTKYDVVTCCYDNILVNVAACVIPGCVCVCVCVCVVRSKQEYMRPHFQDVIITTNYYIVFCHLMIRDFS